MVLYAGPYRTQIRLSSRRLRFDIRPVWVETVVDKVALGQVFLRVLGCPLSLLFPPMIHTHSLIYRRRYVV